MKAKKKARRVVPTKAQLIKAGRSCVHWARDMNECHLCGYGQTFERCDGLMYAPEDMVYVQDEHNEDCPLAFLNVELQKDKAP